MTESGTMFVDFHRYCRKCKYRDEDEFKEGTKCNECMDVPARENSSKPINFERRDRG